MGKRIAIVGAGAVGGYTGAHMARAGEVAGWGKVLGCIASNISVGLVEPGHIHRGGLKGGAAHTVYRTGEVHGRITERAQEVLRLVSHAHSAKATDNLWGERWSKLVTNSMANGVSASTGLSGAAMAQEERIRRFQARVGSEAIRIGQALGYKLEEINHLPPEVIARAGEGDDEAIARFDDRVLTQRRGSAEQRPSMGQDMMKGRRTEIEFLNGFVVREGEKVGLQARANQRLVDIVKQVERGELKQDPRHITELRLN
jgi:2-dehydropantoate 2-reductase